MELTGRITADAVIKTVKDEKQVVNFSIAINEYYKPKGAAEGKQITLYVACSYWQNTAVAQRLAKGAVVEVEGIMYIRVYEGRNGETKAAAHFRCRRINVFGVTAKKETTGETKGDEENAAVKSNIENVSVITEPLDDIPF